MQPGAMLHTQARMQSITPPPSTPAHTAEVSIIRTGRDGRLRFTPEQRRELLAAFDRSGQSAMAFARDHGVHYQTFIAWLRKRRESGTLPLTGPAFAEVLIDPAAHAAAPLRVILPCGSVVEVSSRAAIPLAVELLTALRRPC
jgi:transposase-like protein